MKSCYQPSGEVLDQLRVEKVLPAEGALGPGQYLLEGVRRVHIRLGSESAESDSGGGVGGWGFY